MCTNCICGRVSINTLGRHLDRYSMDIPITTWSTLDWHLINSVLIVGRVSTDSCFNQKLVNCRPRCWWSVNQVSTEVSIECRSRVLIGINRHSTMDAISAHDPEIVRGSVSLKWNFQKIGEGGGSNPLWEMYGYFLEQHISWCHFCGFFMVATCT